MGLLCPALKNARSVWDPSRTPFQDELGKEQNRAARFVEASLMKPLTVPVNCFLEQLKLESFKRKRKQNFSYVALQASEG